MFIKLIKLIKRKTEIELDWLSSVNITHDVAMKYKDYSRCGDSIKPGRYYVHTNVLLYILALERRIRELERSKENDSNVNQRVSANGSPND